MTKPCGYTRPEIIRLERSVRLSDPGWPDLPPTRWQRLAGWLRGFARLFR